jgi:hypothetical protein
MSVLVLVAGSCVMLALVAMLVPVAMLVMARGTVSSSLTDSATLSSAAGRMARRTQPSSATEMSSDTACSGAVEAWVMATCGAAAGCWAAGQVVGVVGSTATVLVDAPCLMSAMEDEVAAIVRMECMVSLLWDCLVPAIHRKQVRSAMLAS